jgi:hypothetical protein
MAWIARRLFSDVPMAIFRNTTPIRLRAALGYGYSCFHPANRIPRWTAFVAALWLVVLLSGCSELAQSSDVTTTQTLPPPTPPAYAALAAKHLQSAFKDRSPYDSFEISNVRWVLGNGGWSWLTCVHFRDRGHPRSYAIFIQNNNVVDARYAVETDDCEKQAYTQFDLMTGELGRPTVPTQAPLY